MNVSRHEMSPAVFYSDSLVVLHCLHKLMISSVNMHVNVCVFGELQSVALVLFI